MKIGIVQVALSHGGAERVGVMLGNGFHNRGHQVVILTDLNERIDYQVDDGVGIVDFVGHNINVLMKWLKAVKNIRQYIRKEKPDVLIGIMGLCTLVTYIASIGLHVPLVMTEHNSFERPDSAPMPLSQRLFKFWINKLYNHITVLTKTDKLYIGNRLRNITVMPNPLVLSPVDVIPDKKKEILAVGRIDAWHCKGFDVLLQAWKSLSPTLPHMWWLKIAGAGKQESFEYLMGLLPDGGWEPQNSGWKSEKYHIEFLGFQTDMESIYKKAEIFVLSSRYEGFGLVLIEAMSQGCAPIACDYKGRQREIISPSSILPHREGGIEMCENGILCEPDNVEALASAIEKMIEDGSYRRIAQENAIQRSHYYSLNNTIKRWELYLKGFVG